MVSSDTVRTVFGILGNIVSFCSLISPTPTFVKIWKKGAVEQFSCQPYLASLMICMLWLLYGIVQPHSTLIITINAAGFLIQITFIALYLLFSDGKRRAKVAGILVLEFAFIATVANLVISLAHTHHKRALIVGSICCFFSVVAHAAPLSIMRMVIRTKSVEYMPFWISLALFANGICWTMYGLIRTELFVMIPNGLGIMLGLVQLTIYATFYKSTKKKLHERKINGGITVSTIDSQNGHA